MSITTTIEQTAGGTGGSPGYTESWVIRRAGRRVQFAFCVYIILYYILLQVTPTANCNSYRVAVGCVPSTMYFGLKLHTENLIIIPHGMPWGIIVLILMTPALPCLLFPLIKFTNHGIKIHILRNFNPHFTEKCLFNVLLELPLWACHPRWICCMLPSSACRHRWISQLVCPW